MARQQVSKWGFVGMGALACVLFLVIGTAGVSPWWVTVLLVVFWLVLLLLGTRLFVPRPSVGAVAGAGRIRGVAGHDRARHQPARLGALSYRRGCTRSTESRPPPLLVVTRKSPPGIGVTERRRP